VQRTAVLVFLVSPDETGENDLLADLRTLLDEVAAFDPALLERPRLVVLGKRDLQVAPGAAERLRAEIEGEGSGLAEISAVTGLGLAELARRLYRMVADHRDGRDEGLGDQ
jgi:GTP-binding protein